MRMMEEIKKASEQTKNEMFELYDSSESNSEIISASASEEQSRKSSFSDDYPSSWDDCPSPSPNTLIDSYLQNRIGEQFSYPNLKPTKLPSDFGSTTTLCPTIPEETTTEDIESDNPKRKV